MIKQKFVLNFKEEQSSESEESDLDDTTNDKKFNHQEQNKASKQSELELGKNNVPTAIISTSNSQLNINGGGGLNGSARRGSFFKSTDLIKLKNTKINAGALQGLNMFHRKHQRGFVDVWWIYDDGGLTILLPYLLKQKKYWKQCKLRIFFQAKSANPDLSEEQRNMATLLSKFRIQYHDLIVFSTTNRKPQAAR